MRIAFYAPLKSPDHPVPSGDRQMARLLIEALEGAGHKVDIASTLRAYLSEPVPDAITRLREHAAIERDRLAAEWIHSGAPDLWFCYHPYYKAPDLLGPELAREFARPYVTAEASYSRKREAGEWGELQAKVARAVQLAAVNFCFTRRDREGLEQLGPGVRLENLPAFADLARFAAQPTERADGPLRLITVAMMRKGDKLASYAMLAAALKQLKDVDWRLSVAGDGPERERVRGQFEEISQRIDWLGEVAPERIPALLQSGNVYVWPGFGEAYGLAYVEAQAAGLPVIAQNTAGIPDVVADGRTGMLTPPGDICAFAQAIGRLASLPDLRRDLAHEARRRAFEEGGVEGASRRLGRALQDLAPKARPQADPLWEPLLSELDLWREQGRLAPLWLRDDDAVDTTPRLGRLIELTSDFSVPLVLAVIPSTTGEQLAIRLRGLEAIRIAVHGWAHANRAPPGEKKQELGPHRPLAVMAAELRRGLHKLRDLYADQLLAMLVPPWNRIDRDLTRELPKLGYRLLSGFGAPSPDVSIATLNTHIDLIDSRLKRSRAPAWLASQLAAELRASRESSGHPVGVLSHHLVHDDEAWEFLNGLFRITRRHGACRWLSGAGLIKASG